MISDTLERLLDELGAWWLVYPEERTVIDWGYLIVYCLLGLVATGFDLPI